MSKSIIIDPGHGGIDPGATGFGIQEKDWCLRMGLYHYERLKELGAKVGITRKTDVTLDSVARTNLIRGKYDYCLSEHWNAFNGQARGVETIYPLRAKIDFARNIANTLVGVSGLPLRRVFQRRNNSGTDWYFMHRLTGNVETVIVEYSFMDHRGDHNWYLNKENFYKAGEAVVKDVCKQIGVTYRAPKSSSLPALNLPVVSGTLYRVQVGAFGERKNADAKQEQLEKANVETYMIQDQGLFKVQVGAYSKKENAESKAKEVEKLGFDTFITTASGSPAHGTNDENVEEVAVSAPSDAVSVSIKPEDKVVLNTSATNYAVGGPIPANRKGKTYTVHQTRPGQVLLREIMSWVHVNDLSLPASTSRPDGKTLHLPAAANSWNVYKPGGPYTRGNEIFKLNPARFGGLSYEIKGNPVPHVYLIDTRDRGRVAIYAGPDTSARIR